MELYLKENSLRTKLNYGELAISSDEECGFRPSHLMIASIAGCSGSVFRRVLKKQRIEIEDLKITAEFEKSAEKPSRIVHIKIHFTVIGRQLNLEKLKKNLEISRKNCPMVRTVEDFIDIEETIEIVDSDNQTS